MKTVCRHDKMYRQLHMPTHKSKVLGGVSFCHAATFWYLSGSWFLIFLELCHSGAGASSLAQSPSSTESGLVNLLVSGLTVCHYFGSVQGVLSG